MAPAQLILLSGTEARRAGGGCPGDVGTATPFQPLYACPWPCQSQAASKGPFSPTSDVASPLPAPAAQRRDRGPALRREQGTSLCLLLPALGQPAPLCSTWRTAHSQSVGNCACPGALRGSGWTPDGKDGWCRRHSSHSRRWLRLHKRSGSGWCPAGHLEG